MQLDFYYYQSMDIDHARKIIWESLPEKYFEAYSVISELKLLE